MKRASQVAQWVKNPAANAGYAGSIFGWEDPLEEGMATHSSILIGDSHGQRRLVGLLSTGSQRVRHD